MKPIHCGLTILVAVAALANADTDSSGHSLDLQASAPTVEVTPRVAARNYLRLPTLEFTFQLTAHCRRGFNPDAVSLSIADSRRSLSAEQLGAQDGSSELTVRVPAKQLAPLAIENFCVRRPGSDGADSAEPVQHRSSKSMTVPAALSAQASLLCVDDDLQEIVYASNPLDITLICKSAHDDVE